MSKSKPPIQYNMLGRAELPAQMGHYSPPSLEDPAEIARARSRPRLSRIYGEQVGALLQLQRWLLATPDVRTAAGVADLLGPTLHATATYHLTGPNMYWPTRMPDLAKNRPSAEEVWEQAVGLLGQAVDLSCTLAVQHLHGLHGRERQVIERDFAKTTARAAAAVVSIELADRTSDPTSSMSDEEVQHAVRAARMDCTASALAIGFEIGAYPGAMQVEDPYSPVIVELERHGTPEARAAWHSRNPIT